MRLERVLFADLDGTIIETKSGKTFPIDCNDWKIKDGIIDAISAYYPTSLFIISNQGGIEKGYFTAMEITNKMSSVICYLQPFIPKTKIDFLFCPTNDKNDPWRKPNPGMIDYFYHDYIGGNDFSKRNALMIGDASGLEGQFSDSDKKCAENAGIKYMDVDEFISKYSK